MFRDRRPSRGLAVRGRGTFGSPVTKFRGSGGIGPWPSRGKRIVDSPYNNAKKKPKEQKPGPKAENLKTFAQKMLITPDPERKYTDDEIDKIKEALLEALEPLEDGYFPQFYGVSFAKGTLIMTCASEQTKRWLERIVPQLKPWEDAKLRVKPKGEVTQGIKIQIKTPKLFAKADTKKILQMLTTQNKTLDTGSWKNISVTPDDSGQTLVYSIDNKSLEAIQALNNKLYLGLGNVEVVILNNEEDEKKTSVITDTKKEEEGDKQNSADSDMKCEEAADEKTSEDTEMKTEEEADKQTS